MNVPDLIFSIVVGFISGSIPFCYILPKLLHGKDIRKCGSGNPGGTNAYLCFGITGIICGTLDVIKAFIPAYFMPYGAIAGFSAVLGHIFSPFLGFRGGKGGACFIGTLLAVNPTIGLYYIISGAIFTTILGVVSIVNILSPFWASLMLGEPISTLSGLIAWFAMVWAHRENIKRLKTSREHKIKFNQD